MNSASQFRYDAVILTDARYVDPDQSHWYTRNVLREDGLLMEALSAKGFRVGRTNWDDPTFDWASARYIIFRTTWDYFERYPEFSEWLEQTSRLTSMINPYETILWNIDKHYLLDLQNKGIRIPPTLFLESGETRSLSRIIRQSGWKDIILKPAVSGGARHTYLLNESTAGEQEALFRELISGESMLLQEFQQSVPGRGELAFMVFGGRFSHAILKKAKNGDFRVQDDFGGSVQDYRPEKKEIEFAEKTVAACEPVPVYARVDVIRDNLDQLCVSELELIEPELWFRNHPEAAGKFAEAFVNFIS